MGGTEVNRHPHPSEVTVHEGVTGILQRIQFVKELKDGWQGEACLVRDRVTNKHYVVSSVVAPFTGYETLVFEADANGDVEEWMEVAGGRGMGRHAAMEDLEERLDEENL